MSEYIPTKPFILGSIIFVLLFFTFTNLDTLKTASVKFSPIFDEDLPPPVNSATFAPNDTSTNDTMISNESNPLQLGREGQLPSTTLNESVSSERVNRFNRTFIHLGTEPGRDLNRIFFHETSGSSHLRLRASCAIESAARENPTRPIQVIMFNETLDASHDSIKLLGEYPNIDIYGILAQKYYANTPFRQWFDEGRWRTGSWPVVHLADYSRVLSLWKGGGIYMDTDFVILKELKGLQNFSCYESLAATSNGVMGFSPNHPVPNYMIEDMAREYMPTSWSGNGPERLYRALKAYCNETSIAKMKPDKCPGFRVMEPKYFYPVYYPAWQEFFKDEKANNLSRFDESYAIHVWNKMSAQTPVQVGSHQIYALAAAKHCPLRPRYTKRAYGQITC